MKFALLTSLIAISVILNGTSQTIHLDSLERLIEIRNQDTILVNDLNKVSYQYWTSDPIKAEKISIKALQLADSLNFLQGKAFALRSLGVANWAQGNYETGLKHLFQSRKYYDSLNDRLNLANVFLNIGLIYSAQSNFKQAQPYFEQSLATFLKLQKPERHVNAANHYGDLYRKEGNFEKAHFYYSNALYLSDSITYDYGKATSLMSLGKLYTDERQLSKALDYCQRAQLLQSKIGDIFGEVNSLYTLGVIYKLEKAYDQSILKLNQALQKADQINAKRQKKDIYFELKEVATLQDNYKKALNFYEKYASIQDSLLNAQMLRNIINLENEVIEQQKEKALQKKSLELMILQKEAHIDSILNYILIGSIISMFGFGLLIYSRQRIKIRKNRELLESQERLTKAEKENSILKEKELKQELAFKSKELTSYALNFKQKNELFTEIKQHLKLIKKDKGADLSHKLNILNRLIDNHSTIDKDWQDFKRYFEEVHSNFFSSLKTQFPAITNNDLKLCALIKLNLNLKESANILGVSPDSVKTARYRLRKKLQLKHHENLSTFLMHFEKSNAA